MWKSWQDFFFYRTLKIFKHVQPTIQTAHTVSELLVYKPSEKLKVILSVSSPSSNPEEDSLFSCVSSPTCRCSVWPKAAPATEHLPLPFPSSSPSLTSYWHGTSCYLGNLCPSCCFWIQPGCRSKRKPSGVNVPCTAPMGYYLKSLLMIQHFAVGFLYKTQRFCALEVKVVTIKV